MSDDAIRVENLSKQYKIGLHHSDTLKEAVSNVLSSFLNKYKFNNMSNANQEPDDTIWALKDVSFEVERGEVVGIIGRNGAGKSTLLKILSRITEPTSGRAVINGRVGSLLEVGTGFHPELTGRENIYLNGAILGMRRAEIDRKFDEIVAFSEIEKFLDTPVKRYSSGMYVRLAFSVAAHMDPEILLIDEVLAVGDIEFQRKCIGKMEQVGKRGRTVLFVSHNLASVQSLCNRILWIQNGKISADGKTNDVIASYLGSTNNNMDCEIADRTDREGRGHVKLINVLITNCKTPPSDLLVIGKPARFSFYIKGYKPDLSMSFTIYDQLGNIVATFSSENPAPHDSVEPLNSEVFICEIEELNIKPGFYRMNTAIRSGSELQDHLVSAAKLKIHSGYYNGRRINKDNYSNVCIKHKWIIPG